MVVAVLGILKAGGAYVPLDPAYPQERLEFMAADAGIAIVLTAWSTRQQIGDADVREVCIDVEWADIARHADANLGVAIDGDNLAYVIYTSGSTGKPKGAMVHHRGFSNYLQWAAEAYNTIDGHGSAVHSSLSFDLTITSLYLPLVTGRPVALLDPRADVDALADAVRDARCLSLLKLTPAHLEVLEQRLGDEDLSGHVNALVIGGEALHHARLQFWRDRAPGTRLVNEYGPTETVVGCCVYDATIDEAAGPVSIGRPIANLQMHILDGNLERVPVGVPGEIYIGGDGVGRGYLGRPDLTADRFVPNPFAAQKGARLYKTGDRARYRADGNIEYLGRLDDQVKIRGYRVELGEIDAAIAEHPGVTQAVVVAREERGGKRLVAYVASPAEAALDSRALRNFLESRLPEYEIPSAFVVLGALPLTVNGKVNRAALPEPDLQKGDGHGSQAPRTAAEGLLHDIWAEVLGATAIGVHDNFFELGGHSLLATRVISRVRQIFDVDVPLRVLFEAPTIAGMAARVEAARRGDAAKPDAPVRVPRDRRMPLSYAQQRLWFLHQLEPNSAVYNIPLALRLTGDLDAPALGRALAMLVERHDVLRTRFVNEDDELMQVVDPAGEVELRCVDFSASLDREDSAQRWAQQEARVPFDLSRGPLLRASLIRLDENQHVLLLVMHHSIVDGWSVGILLEEAGRLYDACRSGQSMPLPELPVQYADYAIWQRRWLQGDVHDRQVDYWKQQLTGLEVLEVAPDRPRPSVQTFNGSCETFGLSESLSVGLRRLSRDEGATMFMTLLAAFQLLLARYTGRKDVAVGTTVANRTQIEVEGLVGFFVNTLVMRTSLDGDPHSVTFREVLRRVRKTCLDGYAHQDLPFEKLVEELHPERDLSRSPFFTILFQLQNAPESPLTMSGLETRTYPLGTDTAKFDLHLALGETGGSLAGSLEYNTDLFEPATIRRLVNHFTTLLEAIAADPEQPISQLPLLTGAELQQRDEWNETARERADDDSLVSRFEARVERTPDAVAVLSGEREWTYTQLNARANQLAGYLLELGVGAESRVGICLERSAEMMMALLAVLKTGAAYVPLDPDYPAARLEYMVADAGIEILLTRTEFRRDAASGPREVLLDVEWDQLARRDATNPGLAIHGDQVAYVLYTSGSTGRPKGVMGSHRATLNRLEWMYETYPFAPREVCCAKASLNFVDSIWELFGPLLKGVPTVLLPAALNYDLDAFMRTLARFRVTRLVLVPSLLRTMLETADGDLGLPDLKDVKYWVTSGEPLPAGLANEFLKRVPHARLLNLYGSSEDAADVTCHELRTEVTTVSAAIGRPIANTEIHILDRDLNPVPVGVPGEICVAGAGLARGYLNRPDLTAEKFVPNPFDRTAASRMYRTGDLGAFQPDGTVAFLGRSDHQVKIRGHRVEIGEVEAALESHPAIKQAIVTAIDDPSAGKMLAAYFVADGEAPAIEELREFLRNALPAYMVPAFFVEMGEMPLTPNAKVDRRALPAPSRKSADGDRVQAPRTDVEEKIGAIWKQLLKIDHVGLDDNFFDVGGHSLQIVRLRSEMRKAFNRELSVLDLFSHPTVRSLATFLNSSNGPRETLSMASIHDINHRANLRREFFNRIQQEVERRVEA